MAALKLPHTAQEVMPFAVLFGTMLAFWRLTRSNELIVARAAGISVWQFLTPPILVALLAGVIAVTVFNPVASIMQASYEILDKRVLRQTTDPLALSNTGLWLRQSDATGDQILIHGEKIGSGALKLQPVTLFYFSQDTKFVARVEAGSARLEVRVLADRRRPALRARPPEPFAQLRLETQLTSTRSRKAWNPRAMSFWNLPALPLLEQSVFSATASSICISINVAAVFVLRDGTCRRDFRRGCIGAAAGGMIASGAAGFLLYFLSDIVFALGISPNSCIAGRMDTARRQHDLPGPRCCFTSKTDNCGDGDHLGGCTTCLHMPAVADRADQPSE